MHTNGFRYKKCTHFTVGTGNQIGNSCLPKPRIRFLEKVSNKLARCVLVLYFTLTARGLEELFFQLCCCVSFLVSGGKQILVLLTYLEYNTVVALCQFFGSGRRQFLVLLTYLVYNTLVWLCQFFGCGGKQCCGRKQLSNEYTF